MAGRGAACWVAQACGRFFDCAESLAALLCRISLTPLSRLSYLGGHFAYMLINPAVESHFKEAVAFYNFKKLVQTYESVSMDEQSWGPLLSYVVHVFWCPLASNAMGIGGFV